MGLKSGYWRDLTTTDLTDVDPETTIAVLPVGAIEQHGPHLPLGTDAAIAEGIVRRALALLPEEASVLVLPTQAVGDSVEHRDFPGTLQASPETLIGLWSDIGRSVARTGIRKMVIFNSHGGQPQIVDIVAQRLRMELEMMVVRATYFQFGTPPGLFLAEELEHGIHGGAFETSMMLHLHPDLVRREAIADFVPLSKEMEQRYDVMRPEGPAGFAWASQDLHPTGACGDATAASAEAGARQVGHAARTLAAVLDDLRRAPLSLLKRR